MAIFYHWHCTETVNGRQRRRKLTWRMTQEQALEWTAHPDNQGKVLELIPGSGEDRGESAGPYLGWGQAVRDDSLR